MKKYSIVIPVLNEERYLKRCLDSLMFGQDYKGDDFEIVLVDGMSEDNSLAIEQSYPVRILFNQDKIQAISMNLAAEQCYSDYIIRCDAHCVYPPDFMSRINQAVTEGKIDFGTFTIKNVGENFIAKLYALFFSSRAGVGNNTFRVEKCYKENGRGAYGVYKRDLLLENKFEEIPTGEDYILFDRLIEKYSHKLIDVRITYFVRDSLDKILKQMFAYGYYKCHVIKYYSAKVTRNNLIALCILPFYIGSAIYGFWPWLLFLHAFAVCTILTFENKRLSDLIVFSSLLTVLIHITYSIGFITRIISIKK